MSDIQLKELDPKIEYVKIHGLQRSGTNYLAHLIDDNFKDTKSLVNLGGWKHGPYNAPWHLGKEVHVAIIFKNPYSWLVSIFKYWGPGKKLRIGPNLGGVSFSQFVRNRCYFERQRDVPYMFRSSNPVQHWNNMNYHWTSIQMNQKIVFGVNHESLAKDSRDILKHMEDKFGVKRKQKDFVNCENTFQPAGESTKATNEKWDKKYYQNHEYLKWFDQDLLDFVNEELDTDLMIKLGYDFFTEAKC